jgi:hypothetical protein
MMLLLCRDEVYDTNHHENDYGNYKSLCDRFPHVLHLNAIISLIWEEFKIMKKTVSFMLSIVLCMFFVASSFAQSGVENTDPAKAVVATILQYSEAFEQYADELQPTLDEPYKEVTLEDGTVLFTSISVSNNSAAKSGMSINAVDSNTMTSSQGVKNALGWVLDLCQ